LGQFNIENLTCAVGCLVSLGFALSALIPVLPRLQAVKGRMEPVACAKPGVLVLVDYAHTPDALQQVLKAIRSHQPKGQLWVVFGCGGDRDQGKRPLMGQVAEVGADRVVLTSDNPRSESPARIVQQIMAGMTTQPFAVELDREKAIHQTIKQAQAGDVVLVAGKGHEDYQEVNGQRFAFCDQACIESFKQ
jgi:UDP-N-acetylmuramoyl-L-alanyl-D-glutamate--2,6-diaminopimelate ligase